jgi:hypothetical protein
MKEKENSQLFGKEIELYNVDSCSSPDNISYLYSRYYTAVSNAFDSTQI